MKPFAGHRRIFLFFACVASSSIASAQGLQWAHSPALDAGVTVYEYALAVFDDGSGRAVYVGGNLDHAGGIPASRIARWNGTSWSAVGQGLLQGMFTGTVDSLQVHDDGTGRALYAGGYFSHSGTTTLQNIARWNGSAWTSLGSGLNGSVNALTSFDDGTGPALYAGGTMTFAGGMTGTQVARWNGTTWSALPPFPQTVNLVTSLAVFTDASGTALFAGGNLQHQGFVARFQGGSWTEFTTFNGVQGEGEVNALQAHDDGTGLALYAGGYFVSAGATPAGGVAKRIGPASWSALPSQILTSVFTLASYDDGNGPALYAGGGLSSIDGVGLGRLARWTLAEGWTTVGPGIDGADCSALCVASLSPGAPPDLYAAGDIGSAGGLSVNNFACFKHADVSGGPFCTGDLTVQQCPCNNWGPPGSPNGCRNSTGFGARLVASGQPSIASDTFALGVTQLPQGTSALFFQGTQREHHGGGSPFGDGLRCAGGTAVRLGLVSAGTGTANFPGIGGASIHVSGGVSAGVTRTYQAWYRDAAAFCTPSTFNLSNGWITTWTP